MMLPLLVQDATDRMNRGRLHRKKNKMTPHLRMHQGRWECGKFEPFWVKVEWWHEGRTKEEAFKNWVSADGFARKVTKT